MNIAEAKEQIKRSVKIYLTKNEDGAYKIPVEKQRPIFLYGAPGIGKTAIMEQISEELDIPLVTYSMTHHTRQSALGLPFIAKKEYKGKEYDISRYTMSEIIAAVYDKIEESGKDEGILFLDEINCVSETLGPAMLQFLQYKIFGSHKVPQGWVVVTAGNPPQFNRSVHEFDIVTMDRLKIVEIEPDYEEWKKYAIRKGIHKAITTYLDIRKQDFYEIETTVDGKSYVTARGWEDLSEAMFLYEANGFPVDESLISQYIRNRQIMNEFAVYYDLYTKYREDYRIHEILDAKEDASIRLRATKAAFDERLTVLGLLTEAVMANISACLKLEDKCKKEVLALREKKRALEINNEDARSPEMQAFIIEKKAFEEKVARLKEDTAVAGRRLSNLFNFVSECFGDGNEMLILITELTVNYSSARFIAEKGCEEYYKYDKKFQLYDRNKELMSEVKALESESADSFSV